MTKRRMSKEATSKPSKQPASQQATLSDDQVHNLAKLVPDTVVNEYESKRRKTANFDYESEQALKTTMGCPATPLEVVNDVLLTQDVGKQYQLAVKDFSIQFRDGRIKRKDKRIAELEEEVETKDVALTEELRQKQELIEHADRLKLLSNYQAEHIKELFNVIVDRTFTMSDQESQIHALRIELEAQRGRVKNLEKQHVLDQVLSWVFGLLFGSNTALTGKPFQLMQLPGELRNSIYKKCLVAPRPIDFWAMLPADAPVGMTRARILKETLKHINVNLLRVSRQVHQETVGILYGCNRFRFSDMNAWPILEGFLLNMNVNCRYLTNISVSCPDWFTTVYSEDDPLENYFALASELMQPILNRFHLTLDGVPGPSLNPMHAYGRAMEMLLKLPKLKTFTLIIPHNIMLHGFSVNHLIKMLTDEDKVLYPSQSPASNAERKFVLLRRGGSNPRIWYGKDMDCDIAMGRKNFFMQVARRGLTVRYGAYGEWTQGVSYTVEGEKEEEFDVDVPVYIENRRSRFLLRPFERLLGY